MIGALVNSEEWTMKQAFNEDYFNICKQKDGTYLIKTKSGETIAVGMSFHAYPSGTESKYISVIDKKGLRTLYDRHGKPLPQAQNVVDILWNGCTYSVQKKFEHRFEEYKLPIYKTKCLFRKMALLAGIGVAALGVSQIKGCCEKQAEFERKTQITYLGVSDGVALFDTDGNKQTAEMVAETSAKDRRLDNRQIGRLYGCEGQTQSIATWKEKLGCVSFSHTR